MGKPGKHIKDLTPKLRHIRLPILDLSPFFWFHFDASYHLSSLVVGEKIYFSIEYYYHSPIHFIQFGSIWSCSTYHAWSFVCYLASPRISVPTLRVYMRRCIQCRGNQRYCSIVCPWEGEKDEVRHHPCLQTDSPIFKPIPASVVQASFLLLYPLQDLFTYQP